jgi:molybdopterin converting factor small subunit
MAITLLIPTALRAFADQKSEVSAKGATVGETLADFTNQYPDIRRHLYEDDGKLRSFINVFVGEINIKTTGGLDTPLSDGATVMLVPAIAGGTKGSARL